MTDEVVWRCLLGAILVAGLTISGIFRRRADRAAGRVSRRADGLPLSVGLAVTGLGAIGGILAYLVNPRWMAWSQVDLPPWLRVLGGLLGVAVLVMFVQVLRALGPNVTPTSATRERHTLVTHGPYRLVRHPMYSAGAVLFVAYALLTASWFVAACCFASFALLVVRTNREEANLIARFGDDYRAYMERTGRFVPRW